VWIGNGFAFAGQSRAAAADERTGFVDDLRFKVRPRPARDLGGRAGWRGVRPVSRVALRTFAGKHGTQLGFVVRA
jgi:hypothetical protein